MILLSKQRFIYEDTLDTYYVRMINDVLSEIKKKHEAYVFSFEHIKEILSFYPTAKFTYIKDSDCFEAAL